MFSLGTYKTDICVPKQLSVYTQVCAVYKISWGRWAGGILSTLKIKQKGFCPKKGFCPSWKIYRRDSVHLVKMSGRDYIHVAQNIGGIMSTYTKMSRRDYVQEGFCPRLEPYMAGQSPGTGYIYITSLNCMQGFILVIIDSFKYLSKESKWEY